MSVTDKPTLPADPVMIEEAARILDVKERTLYRDRYTNKRYPRAYKIGRTLVWSRRELEEHRREHPGRKRGSA